MYFYLLYHIPEVYLCIFRYKIREERGETMPKLTFFYGVMNSSKSARALIQKFSFEEKGFSVGLLKPAVDTRDGGEWVRSRIGLCSPAHPVAPDEDLNRWYLHHPFDVLVVDEAQFLSGRQVEALYEVACASAPVFCYGLASDFRTRLFPGSRRLFELADELVRIEALCACGRVAQVNARIENGKILREGSRVEIGGNERYQSMCYRCYRRGLSGQAHGD